VKRSLLLGAALVCVAPILFAQRRLPPMFSESPVTMTGAVVQVMVMNPESLLIFNVSSAGPGEEVVRWQAILPSQQVLRSCFGWNKTSIKAGDVILVTGHAARSGAPLINLLEMDSELVASSGQTLFSGASGIGLRRGAPCITPRPVAPGPSSPAR